MTVLATASAVLDFAQGRGGFPFAHGLENFAWVVEGGEPCCVDCRQLMLECRCGQDVWDAINENVAAGRRDHATWAFNLWWPSDPALYRAVLAYADRLLRGVPGMTPQTVGRNVRDEVARWAFDGIARPWDSAMPVSPILLRQMASEVGSFLDVGELAVGEAVLGAIEIER